MELAKILLTESSKGSATNFSLLPGFQQQRSLLSPRNAIPPNPITDSVDFIRSSQHDKDTKIVILVNLHVSLSLSPLWTMLFFICSNWTLL